MSKKKTNGGGGCGCLVILVLIVLISIWYFNDGNSVDSFTRRKTTTKKKNIPKNEGTWPKFEIVETTDISTGLAVRKNCRVRVKNKLSDDQLLAITKMVLKEVSKNEAKAIDALVVFFYLPESSTASAYTAGKVTWAPDGDWSKAATNLAPKFVVTNGSAIGDIPKGFTAVDLPLATKQKIFLRLLELELKELDQLEADILAGKTGERENSKIDSVVAKEFGISEKDIKSIGTEGIYKSWPMK